MSKRLAYAGWVRLQLQGKTKAQQQEIRNELFSEHGRVVNYDRYVRYCRDQRLEPDNPPEGYKEYYYKGYEKPRNLIALMLAALIYLLAGIVGGSTGIRR